MKRSLSLILLISLALPAQAGWLDPFKSCWNYLTARSETQIFAMTTIATATAALGMYTIGGLIEHSKKVKKNRYNNAVKQLAVKAGCDNFLRKTLQIIKEKAQALESIEHLSDRIVKIKMLSLAAHEEKNFIKLVNDYNAARSYKTNKPLIDCVESLLTQKDLIVNSGALAQFTDQDQSDRDCLKTVLETAQRNEPVQLETTYKISVLELRSPVIEHVQRYNNALEQAAKRSQEKVTQSKTALTTFLTEQINLYDQRKTLHTTYAQTTVPTSSFMRAGHFFTGMTLAAAIATGISSYKNFLALSCYPNNQNGVYR